MATDLSKMSVYDLTVQAASSWEFGSGYNATAAIAELTRRITEARAADRRARAIGLGLVPVKGNP